VGVHAVDMKSFRQFQRRLDTLASGSNLPGVAERLAAVTVKLVADEFRESRNPYGEPWAPVARNRPRDQRARARGGARAKRGDKPLVDTGVMRGSVAARVTGTQIRVMIPVEYASYHQTGTRNMVRRQMLPDGATGGLGPIWTAALNREAGRILSEQAGGSR
jgi:phage gpG-like protein